MSSPPRIALIVDNPYRDLPGLVLVAHRLCQEGMVCHLVSTNLRWSELWPLKPDFVLLSHLDLSNEKLGRTLHRLKVPFGVLDAEGGVWQSPSFYGSKLEKGSSVRAQAAFFFSWGDYLAGYAVEEGWYRPEQIRVTGSPRFDFYAPRWRQAALRALPAELPPGKKMVLMNCSFQAANPLTTPEREVEIYVKYLGLDRAFWEKSIEVQKLAIVEFSALANRLARRFPEIHFVVRPHPFEKLETYHRLLERMPNLHPIKSGTVDGWILRSSAVIQYLCTTAVEAGMAEVPSLSPDWLPCPQARKTPEGEGLSFPCPSEEKLCGVLEEVFAGNFKMPAQVEERLKEVVRRWFYSIDGKAHERVALSILEKIRAPLSSSAADRRWLDLTYRYSFGSTSGGLNLQARAGAQVRRWLNLPAQWSFRKGRLVTESWWDRTEKQFDLEQVARWSEAIQHSNGSAQNGSSRMEAALARQRGDYAVNFHGRSVTLSKAGSLEK